MTATDLPPSTRSGSATIHFAPHLVSFWIPLNATAFLLTGPHPWYGTVLFIIPLVLAHRWDSRWGVEQAQPDPDRPAWPFDLLVYGQALIQLLNIVLLARLFVTAPFFSLDTLLGIIFVGAASAFSIITAHELIHRPNRLEQLLGRAVLCSVLYEHFYTEHLRGHHSRVGRDDDPATARFGESFWSFYFRTVPAQFKSAWRLETRRLGDEDMSLGDRRLLRSRVVHGVVVEWGAALAIALVAGPAALFIHVLQAFFATRALETVNYFEHWGLAREDGERVGPQHSWDTHSRFTYYALTGLSRHADHHAFASRPYQQLRVWEEPPVLPRGYIGMVPLVIVRNRHFQELATEELRRKGLGPFAKPA